MTKRISVGLLAHVDAGKTTLGEALMFASGNLKKPGRVDHGSSFLDTDAQERARGITIFSKQAIMPYGDAVFTLLDTPGHVDFSAETERTLQVLDYAVLVVSGTDGVQSHTLTLWRLLERYRVPVFLFVNKMDLPGAEKGRLLRQLQGRFGEGCVDFTALNAAFYENAALCSEKLFDEYERTGVLSQGALCAAIKERSLFPCMFGAALRNEGIEALLERLACFTETPDYGDSFSGRVFKLGQDAQGSRLTFLKVTGGTLRVKDVLQSPKNEAGEKVQQIRFYSGEKFTSADAAPAGSVVAVTGISFARPGDGLGEAGDTVSPFLTPVLSYKVNLPEGADTHGSLLKLQQLAAEDPQLQVTWDERLNEIRLRPMGEVQLEILANVIETRFGLKVTFGRGGVVYKETIENTVEGVGHFEPLRHYAEVHLILKPGPRGSGLRFSSACREDTLDKNWQRLILTHLYEKTHIGVLTGAPITDMEIVLASGRAHPKHTEGGDFRQATYRAVRQGLREAKSLLLEPMYDFTLETPAENVGRAITDIQNMSGTFTGPETFGDTAVLTGTAPAAALAEYGAVLTGYTRGKGKLACTFSGYAPCHNAEEVIAAAGYDPDADLANPCDSVFCAHGAGFNVKWNEVKSHMHLSAALSTRQATPALQTLGGPKEKKRSSRPDIFAADKELIAIFEQTYGPIRSRSDPFELRRHDAPVKKEKPPKPIGITYTGTEYVLVDGYNVIYSWEELRALAEDSMADARDALIRLMGSYRGFRGCELILVFDAYRVPHGAREIETAGGISVVYTKEAETADTYIEITAHELAKNHRVRVVTGDGMERLIILGDGALRVSPEAFYAEIGEQQKEMLTYLSR